MKNLWMFSLVVLIWSTWIEPCQSQTQPLPSALSWNLDTTGYAKLKEKQLEQILQHKDVDAILTFLALEIQSGFTHEAIATLEDWQIKDGGTAQGLFLLSTAYSLQGNTKKALLSMENAQRRNANLGNNSMAQELRYLRTKANPLGRPEKVNGVYSQFSLEEVRNAQTNAKQVALWKSGRTELFNWLNQRLWVHKSDSIWISWMFMDMGEYSYLIGEEDIAIEWFNEALKINPQLQEAVQFRREKIQPISSFPRYLGMSLVVLSVLLGLWLYTRSQRQVEATGK
jgi:tetratricopeptide (TPR) repeat protein